ncbi:MAG TPA: hypothetical protein VMB21_19710, partial [Candidatus Limnocylindria bacterium]|nr:hypothetical protein [Candidatus Limnocylindria bacterium]
MPSDLPSPSPADFAAWLVSAAAVIALTNGLFKLAYHLRSKPSPGEVETRADRTFATKESLDRHITDTKKEHEHLFAKLGGMERGLRAETDLKIGALRDKVDDIAVNVSAVAREAEDLPVTLRL